MELSDEGCLKSTVRGGSELVLEVFCLLVVDEEILLAGLVRAVIA